MAQESTKRYFDIDITDYSDGAQVLAAEQSETYKADKAARKALVEALKLEIEVEEGDEIVAVGYTRWGQMQITIDRKQAKAKAKSNRPSLSDYQANAKANGRNL